MPADDGDSSGEDSDPWAYIDRGGKPPKAKRVPVVAGLGLSAPPANGNICTSHDVDRIDFRSLLGLTEGVFRVPLFQRRYCWVETTWVQLLSDIATAHCEAGEVGHSVGKMFVFEQHGGMDVVDGQQRMTTLTLVLAAVRDVALSLLAAAKPAQARALNALVERVHGALFRDLSTFRQARAQNRSHPASTSAPSTAWHESVKLLPTYFDREPYFQALDPPYRLWR